MAWRLAKSLEVLRDQANKAWPGRSTISDGTLGDPAHAARTSDHNPDSGGVVRALDLTHDPAKGADMDALADELLRSKDPRIKYVIWNRRSFNSSTWTWASYSGSNPHDKHIHVSVVADYRADSTRPWAMPGKDWFGMASKKDLREVVKEEVEKAENRLRKEIHKARRMTAVGADENYPTKDIHLKRILNEVKKA